MAMPCFSLKSPSGNIAALRSHHLPGGIAEGTRRVPDELWTDRKIVASIARAASTGSILPPHSSMGGVRDWIPPKAKAPAPDR